MRVVFVIPGYDPFVGGAQTFCREMAHRLAADGHKVTVVTTNAQQADDFWRRPGRGRERAWGRDIGDWGLDIRDWGLDIGDWGLAIGDWRLEIGQAAGGRRQSTSQPVNQSPNHPITQSPNHPVTIHRLPVTYPWPAPYTFGVLRRISHWLGRRSLPEGVLAPVLRLFARTMPPVSGLQSKLGQVVNEMDVVVAIDAGWDGMFVAASTAAEEHGKPLVAVPLVHTGHPNILAHFAMAHLRSAYRSAAAVTALTRAEAALLEGWGVPQERIHHIPMGVDPAAAWVDDQEAAKTLQRLGVTRPFVLFLGAATYDKGAWTLAEAFARCVEAGVDADLVYAGPQQERLAAFLKAQPALQRQSVQTRLHLLGVVTDEEKHALLSTCRLLALPSRVDSFGIVLLEAWLHGKPVVATQAGGPAELIQDGQTGLLAPFGDVEALALALKRLLEMPHQAAQMGAHGRQVVVDNYTWDKTYDSFHWLLRTTAQAERLLPI